jgi:hypothetical protein
MVEVSLSLSKGEVYSRMAIVYIARSPQGWTTDPKIAAALLTKDCYMRPPDL